MTERQEKAKKLRAEGLSLKEVGRRLDPPVSRQAVHSLIERAGGMGPGTGTDE